MDSEPPPSNFFSLPILILALFILLSLSLTFSIAESSFLSMNKLRLRIKRRKGDKRAVRASVLLSRKDLLINTLLLANDLVNILLSSILTAVCVKTFGAGGLAYATFGATLLLLIFGEITPKTISTRHADSIAYALSGFIFLVVQVLKPASFLLTSLANLFLRALGINVKQKSPSYTEEEIRTFVDYGSEEGAIDKDENAIMHRIFKFTDLEAQDIMVPRTQIVALPHTAGYKEILEIAQETNHSRFPIFKDTIDDIVGVLYIKDLLIFSVPQEMENFSLEKIMRPPVFILGTKKMSSVRELLRENQQTIAIIVDEYSGTDGIITQSDISERIFGGSDFSSGSDSTTGDDGTNENPNDFTVDGSALLADLSEKIGITLSSQINETLGGWIEEKLDRMAIAGDAVFYDGWQFTVQSVEARRVVQVRVLNDSDYGAGVAE